MAITPFTIKRLTASDATLLRDLNACFAKNFEDANTYMARAPSLDYLSRLLRDGPVIAIVVLAESRVVGGLVAYVLEKFEQARREIYIYDLAVDPEMRRQGCATALLSDVRRIAHEIGAWTIFVQADVDVEDAPARALYESLGTRMDVVHFDITPLPR